MDVLNIITLTHSEHAFPVGSLDLHNLVHTPATAELWSALSDVFGNLILLKYINA
jgi:hypothetical protein